MKGIDWNAPHGPRHSGRESGERLKGLFPDVSEAYFSTAVQCAWSLGVPVPLRGGEFEGKSILELAQIKEAADLDAVNFPSPMLRKQHSTFPAK